MWIKSYIEYKTKELIECKLLFKHGKIQEIEMEFFSGIKPFENNSELADNIEILKNCSSLYNMIQDLSHGIIRSSLAISSDDIKKGCRTISDYIESKYAGQLNNIKKTI